MKVGAILLIQFGMMDVFLTDYALTNWNAQEINPIAEWLWEGWGIRGLVLGKFVLFALVFSQIKFDPTIGRWTVWVCAIVQIVVVALTLSVHLIGLQAR